jgi:hypothetical protein
MTLPGFVQATVCPICGSADIRHHKTITSPPNLVYDGFCLGSIPVRIIANYGWCVTCDLIFQNPRMTDMRVSEYYASGVYRATIGIDQENLDLSEGQRGERLAAWLRERDIAPASHLDMGCSRTYFLEMVGARERLGFDENTNYAGEGVYVENDPAKLGKYELVSAIHVLEHTTDPLASLAWYASLTARWLLLEVPQRDAPLRFPHLYYFPPALLVKMVQDAGMKIVNMSHEDVTRILAIVA